MTVPQIGPAGAFDLALRDLAATRARLATMHDEAWYPKPPDHDRPTPVRPVDAAPDVVPGAPRDCGLGDHRVRQGWERMVVHLHAAEQKSTVVLCAALARESRRVPACRPTSLLDAQRAVRTLEERVRALRALWRVWSGDNPDTHTWRVDVGSAQWLARQLMGHRANPAGSCFDEIRLAADEARRVVVAVGTGKPPATCSQCRRLGSIGQPRIGGLCYACDARNKRAGVPRRTSVTVRQRRTTIRAARR